MTIRHLSVALGAASLLAPFAFPQSVLVQQGEVIAATGDVVPGLVLGETFGNSSTFDTGVIDDSGKVLFRGRFIGGSVTSLSDRALFYGSNRANLQLVVRAGDPEPSGTVPGATLNSASSGGVGSGYRITRNGIMLFGATMSGGAVTTANDTAFYVGTPGSFQILVREGDVATVGGATFSSSFSSPSQQNTSLSAAGIAMFKSSLTGGDVVGTTNNEALFVGTPGNLTMVVRKGDIAPGGEVIAGVMPGFVSQMNESGQVMFDVSFVAGTGTPAVTTANDRALWLYTPGSGNVQLIREGDASPISGVTYNNAANTWGINTGSTTFNAAGEALLRVDLAGAVTAGFDDSAVVKVSTSGQTVVARRGDPIGAIAGLSFNAFNNVSIQLNNSGRVAFECSVFGASGTTDDSLVVSGTAGNWELVLREGDATPNHPGFVFGDVNGVSLQQNNAGHLIIAAGFNDGVNFPNAYWGWRPGLGLQELGSALDNIETSPGSPHLYGSSGGVQFSNGASRPLTTRDNGDFTHRVTFQDATSAIMVGSVGSFNGVPHEISSSNGGVHDMYLNAGAAQAGYTYFVLGSVSGTTPGFTVNGINCPLNPDGYFDLTIAFANTGLFSNTLALLGPDGRATAALIIPPALPGLVGITLNHAYLTFNPFGALKFASRADSVTFTP
jgi:hypothetical protein